MPGLVICVEETCGGRRRSDVSEMLTNVASSDGKGADGK